MITQYNFELNKEMIYLIETLKVESYWNLKNFTLTLQNKDVPFLNHIETIVSKLNINIGKRLLLKVRLKDKTKKEDVKIINNNRELNFHIEKSPFNNNKVKAVTSLPFKKNYQITLLYKNKEIPIRIKCLKKKIICDGEIDCWVYKDLRFPTKKILEFLTEYCGGNKNVAIEEFLLNSKNPSLISSAFSALVDCEGSINWYGLKRNLEIRMKEKQYLLQWKNLLKRFEIDARIEKRKELWGLVIEGWEDFNRLEKIGFKLYHSKKAERWKNIIEGFKRNQISRNSYKKFYINKLKEINKKVTSEEFAKYVNKNKRTTDHFFSKLKKEGLIHCDKNHWPYLYFIST